MNILKKTLAKDDISKYTKKKNQYVSHQTKIHQTQIHNKNNWTDINQLIQCVVFYYHSQRTTYQQSLESAVQQKIKSLIQKSFQAQQLTVQIDFLIRSIQSIIQQYYPEQQFDRSRTNFNLQEQKIMNILQVLFKIQQKEEKDQITKSMKFNFFLEQLRKTNQKIRKYLQQVTEKRKKRHLDQYNQIISFLKPSMKRKQQKKQQKRQNVQKLNKKLLNSLSSGNLHIKVTTQQISIQKANQNNPQEKITRKKSEGNLFNLQNNFNVLSPRNQGQAKLHNFLKDQNVKIVKTKVEYDYNAILEASKSNIQSRNKTTNVEMNQKSQINMSSMKKNNFQVSNINKAKKDQAFVFYRPKPGKSSK